MWVGNVAGVYYDAARELTVTRDPKLAVSAAKLSLPRKETEILLKQIQRIQFESDCMTGAVNIRERHTLV